MIRKLSLPRTGIDPPLVDTDGGPVPWDRSARGGILCPATLLPYFQTLSFAVRQWRMTGSFPLDVDEQGNPEFDDVDILLNSYWIGLAGTSAPATENVIISNNVYSTGPSDQRRPCNTTGLFSPASTWFRAMGQTGIAIRTTFSKLDTYFPPGYLTPFSVRGKMFLPSIFYGGTPYGDIRAGIIGTGDADRFEETSILVTALGTSIELPAFSFHDPNYPKDFTPKSVRFQATSYYSFNGRFDSATGAPVVPS